MAPSVPSDSPQVISLPRKRALVARCVSHFCTVVILTLAGLLPAHAQVGGFQLWQDLTEQEAAARLPVALKSTAKRDIVPQAYRTLALNKASMAQLLASAPAESPTRSPDAGSEILLPLPEGGYGRFSVLESPLMEPALAAQFPEIKNYIVQGIDDPTASGRIDTSPKGFRAMIISASGTFFIDPYWSNSDAASICYAKKDFVSYDKLQEWSCGVVGDNSPVARAALSLAAQSRPTGATLRVYRAAIAATGEYTAFHGGTVAGALAAINTTLARVNTVYERDFCIRMVLIGNNNSIIYTTAATDPYTNGNPGAMITENQTNIDNVIGNLNYDIGHVFGTDSGGLAGLGVVCETGFKAQGVTGSSAPVGDPFDVDYVAHEMGHQFAANHTFNASGNGNRNASTAFEPGSGSTIMSYAGIVAGQNLQEFANDYFHTGSYTEIDNYTSTGIGAGAISNIATGNSPPVVGALSNYTIPARTPFALTASATDANGDTLTYCWEEYDVGAAQNPVTANPRDNGASPIFRSYSGTTNPTRLFPSLPYILNNTNNPPTTYTSNGVATWATGEALPTTSRNMTYRVSVRDNRAGGGGQNWASAQVTTISNAGPFRISSQNAATTVSPGTPFNVTWDVAGTTNAPISADNVKISLSTNGGTNFPIVLAESVPNNGTASVTIPAGNTTTAGRLKVEPVGNIFFDVNDANLTVSTSFVPGQITLADTNAYTENFDSMGALSNAPVPNGFKMSAPGQGTSAGWDTVANLTNVTQQASSGSPTSGGRYNWGSNATDRAAGFMTSGSYGSPNGIMAKVVNNTGSNMTGLNVSFDIERYRINTAAANVTFFTSSDGAAWTAVTDGDSGAFATGTSSYTFAGGTVVSKTLSLLGLAVPNGGSFYLKWNFNTSGGSSQGLGLDNLVLRAVVSADSAPAITTFTPALGLAGTSVTINGLNFTGATAVTFGGVSATSFNVVNATSITAQVPVGAVTGAISVTTPQGTATSPTQFVVGAPPPSLTANPPAFTGFNTVAGTPSSPFSYTVSASNLTGNLVVAPSNAAFEVSADNLTFGSSITLPQTGGSVSATVYVRLAATAPIGAVTGTMSNSIEGSGTSLASTPTLSGSVAAPPVGDLVAGWDFQTTATGGTAVTATDSAQPKLFNANVGSGVLYLDGSNGSSDWLSSATTTRELNAFGGTAINALGGLSTVTASPASLVVVNSSANGKFAVFRFSMAGYQDLSISLTAQRTSTGFNQQVWEYSTDGTTWTSIGVLAAGTTPGTLTGTFADSGVITLPTTAGLDNASNAYVRARFNGATAATGNNRIDNIQFRATPASGPRIAVSPASINNLAAVFGSPGTPQSITVTGVELTAGINVAVTSANYQVAVGGSGNFGSSAVLTSNGGTIDVRIASGVAIGNVAAASVTFNSTGAAEKTVAISGAVTNPNQPSLAVSTNSLAGFSTTVGTASSPQTFDIIASNLISNVVIAPPAGFAVSTNGSTFSVTNLTIPLAQFVSPATISVRLTGAAAGSPSGSVAVTSGALSGSVNVSGVVSKATPSITASPTATAITFGQTLGSSSLSGGSASEPGTFAFTTPSATPNAGTANQSVTFTPTDTANYNTVTTSVSVTVNKATPTIITLPTATAIPAGQTLASSTLSGGSASGVGGLPLLGTFAFTTPTTVPVATADQSVTFTPEDTANYNTVITSVSVTVTNSSTPAITMSPVSLGGFLAAQGSPSTNQVVTVSGTNLQGPIMVTAPANYEVSRDGTNFSASLSLTPVAPRGIAPANSAPAVIASDTAGNYGTAATNTWTNGSNLGSGFGPWQFSVNSGSNGFAGVFVGNPADAGITGFPAPAFGMYANPGPSGASATINRPFAAPLNVGDAFSFKWAINWDSDVGNKGFSIFAGTNEVVNVNQGGFPGNITFNTVNTGLLFGSNAMTWSVARTASNNLLVTSTPRTGGTNIAFSTNITVAAAPTSFRWYVSAMGPGDQRQPYFNDLQITSSGGGGGGNVSDTTLYVRLKSDAAAANTVTGALTATSQDAATRTVALSGRVAQVTTGTNSLAPFVSLNGAASSTQTFTVSGEGLETTPITIDAPVGFQVSDDGGTSYSSSLTLTPVSGAVTSTTITVRMPAGQTIGATPSGNITLTSAPASRSVAVTGSVLPPGPTILFEPGAGISGLSTTQGTASPSGSLTVSGFSLSDNITANAPAGFEVAAAGGTFGPTATLPSSGGTLDVRITANAAEGLVSGDVALASGGITATVPVSGSVGPTPVISIQPSTLQPFRAVVGFSPPPQRLTVGGSGLVGPITFTLPAGYRIFVNGAVVAVGPATGTLASPGSYELLLELTAIDQPGTPGGDMTFTSQGAVPVVVPLEGVVLPRPVVSVSPTAITNLLAYEGFPSAPGQFVVGGTNVFENLVVTAPQGFEVSRNGTNYQQQIVLPFESGTNAASAFDTAAAYNVWTNGANEGTGFGPWALGSNNGTNNASAGFLIGSSTNGAGNIDTAAKSFAIFAYPATAFANADRSFAAPMTVGSRLSFRLAVNFDNGNKGFDLFSAGPGGTQLINFNIGNGAAVNAGSGFTVTPGSGLGYNYGGPAVLDVSITYVSPTELSYSITRNSPQGNQGVLFSGKITSVTPFAAPGRIRFYNSGTDNDGGQNNLYVNSLSLLPPLPDKGGTIPPTTVFARIAGTAQFGAVSGSVAVTGGFYAEAKSVVLSGQVVRPEITASPTTLTLVAAEGEPSKNVQNTFVEVNGSNLVSPIIVAAPVNYEVSLSTAPDSFGAVVSLVPVAGVVGPTTVYVRIAATAPSGPLPAADLQLSSAGSASSPPAANRFVTLIGSVQPWPEVNPFALRVRQPAAVTSTTNALFTFAGQAGIEVASPIRWTNLLTGQAGSFGRADDWTVPVPLGFGSNNVRFEWRVYDANNIVRVALDSPDYSSYIRGWTNNSSGGFGFAAWQFTPAAGATNFRTTSATNLNLAQSINAFTMRAGVSATNLVNRRFETPLVPASIFEIQLDPNTIANGGSLGLALRAGTNSLLSFSAEGGASQPSFFSVSDADGIRVNAVPYTAEGLSWKFELLSATNYRLTVTPNAGGGPSVVEGAIMPGAIDTLVLSNRAGGTNTANNFYAGRMEIRSPSFADFSTNAPTVVRATAYEAWAQSFGLDASSPGGRSGGDHDGDGTSNFEEFAFGGDPKNPASPVNGVSSMTREATGLVVTYLQRLEGANYEIQHVADLQSGTWVEAQGIVAQPSADQTAVPHGYRRMEFRVSAIGTAFYRVEASLP